MRSITRVAAATVSVGAALLVAPRLRATTLDLPLSAHAQADSPDANTFVLTSPDNPVYTNWTSQNVNPKEQRAILEFSLASLPYGATIDAADLTFDVASAASTTINDTTLYPEVIFYGYAGNNAADVADAYNVDQNPLANLRVTDTGRWTLSLDPGMVQQIVAGGAPAIGVVTYASSDSLPMSVYTQASGSAIVAPFITLTYSAPLAGDFNGDGTLDHTDLSILTSGYANHLSGYANGDFNRDGSINADDFALFDRALATYVSPTAPLATATPEPTSLLAACGFVLPLRRRRRR